MSVKTIGLGLAIGVALGLAILRLGSAGEEAVVRAPSPDAGSARLPAFNAETLSAYADFHPHTPEHVRRFMAMEPPWRLLERFSQQMSQVSVGSGSGSGQGGPGAGQDPRAGRPIEEDSGPLRAWPRSPLLFPPSYGQELSPDRDGSKDAAR